ncbi:hypothetical protein B0H11DRAFT_1997662 [Mycena galericulata]|nr:hypothetical protein B0H11DRAFT_1997662 [Mycena galericulata]
MHRAWKIVELVQMICAQVALDGPIDSWAGLPVQRYPLRRRDLSRLARTSTIFLNPALDILWRYQATLLNLLRTMPNDLWDITETRLDEDDDEEENASLKIALRRAVTTADWARCIFYSRRVKSFNDNHVLLETSEFPIDPELFHHVRLFLSPGLNRLHLTMDCIPDPMISETLTAQFPGLTDVSIAGSAGYAAIPSISRFICALRDVETLVVVGLDSVAFSHIARFPRLRYLWLMSNKPTPFLQPPTDLPHFPALRTLECESIEHAPTLLERVKSSLVEFTLIARGWRATPTKRTIQELYSALATNCAHSSLQRITVQKHWRSEAIGPDQLNLYLVSGEELKPLFYFRNLVVVSLSHTAGVDLDDEVVLIMARAWPCLESLSLPSDSNYRINPRVTLEGVYAFAKYCPRLEDLTILFDATIVPELKIRSKIGSRRRVSQDSLVDLDVAYSPIGTKPRRVAKFLRTIFPCLEGIQTSYHEHPQSRADAQVIASHKAWMKVDEAL